MTPADPFGPDATGDPTPSLTPPPLRSPLSSLPPLYEAGDEISLDDPTAPEVEPGHGPAPARLRDTGPDPVLAPTPGSQRVVRPIGMFPLWFAANSSPITVVVGGVLYGLGLSVGQTIVAVVIGVGVSSIPVIAAVIASHRSGRPTMALSGDLLGTTPRFRMLPAAISVVPRVVATAVLLWLLSSALGDLAGGRTSAAVFAGAALVVAGAVAVVVAVPGFRAIASLQRAIAIIVGALVLAFLVVAAGRIDLRVAFTIGDGPASTMIGGAVLVFCITGLLWATGAGDLSRHVRSGSSGAATAGWASLGMLGPALVFVPVGALLAGSDAELAADFTGRPVRALVSAVPDWFAVPVAIAVLVGLTSAVVVSVYSGGLAIAAALPRVPRVAGSAAVAAASALLAVTFTVFGADAQSLLQDGSTTIGVPIAAWAGVFTARTVTARLGRDGGPGRQWSDLLLIALAIVVGWGLTASESPALAWQGYLWAAAAVPVDQNTPDIGVFVALVMGLAAFATTGRARRPVSRGSHRTGDAR